MCKINKRIIYRCGFFGGFTKLKICCMIKVHSQSAEVVLCHRSVYAQASGNAQGFQRRDCLRPYAPLSRRHGGKPNRVCEINEMEYAGTKIICDINNI